MTTHEVINQPKPLENYNVFSSDSVLRYWLSVFTEKEVNSDDMNKRMQSMGQAVGGELQPKGFLANKHLPELMTHDRFGHRIDVVEYHPSYHDLMNNAIQHGHCGGPWLTGSDSLLSSDSLFMSRISHIERAGIAYMHTHADPGSGCPLTMTFSSVPAIQSSELIANVFIPRIQSLQYDPSNAPFFDKAGVTIGMAMTEKQGGSDVRANTTRATFVSSSGLGDLYELTGHKWFCSAPMSDAFLVLAKTDKGVSCFLVPRFKEDGSKNHIFIQRLKNKTGNKSNASSEIEFQSAHGFLLGEEGRGVNTIIQMVTLTRYDCMIGSSALMMQGVKEAVWHCSQRMTFGKRLTEHALMKNVLADLALDAEAALSLSLRMSKALENPADPHESALLRIGTAIGKYWICKRAVLHSHEAMESIGGVGYIEDNVTSRLYKEAPVNSIWEGSGNIQCLDVIRAIVKNPECLAAIVSEIEKGVMLNETAASAWMLSKKAITKHMHDAFLARQNVETLALFWQASNLLQFGDAKMAQIFCDTRLSTKTFLQYGTLSTESDIDYLIERICPKTSE